MEIDSIADSDDEEIIISGDEVPVGDDEDDENDTFVQTMEATSAALGGIDLDGIAEVAFDFLPDPDVDIGHEEAAAEPHTIHHNSRCTLVDMDDEQPTFKWHSGAGQIYGIEPTIHARWNTLFQRAPGSQPYEPFNSRLDWEIAQWTVKEQISQKSFNRLLNIPEVNAKSYNLPSSSLLY